VDELIIVAAHGPDHIGQCMAALTDAETVVVVDTGSGQVPGRCVRIAGGYPTGAYRWAYQSMPADRYLFIQDSMTALESPLPWFRDQFPAGGGAVAWARFPQQWDSAEQRAWVEAAYPGTPEPSHGIFGPVFYTDRASLDVLAGRGLLPPVPVNRLQAQGTERAWAYAFAAAGLPVVGPDWDPVTMAAASGFGPFRKTWAARP
jgi:hypothetical protein